MSEAAVAEDAPDLGIFQEANLVRARYRLEGQEKVRLPVRMLAPHKDNRGGQYPQDERVRELAVQIIVAGFTQAEADHEGVCVEEYPAVELCRKKDADPLFKTYTEFNHDHAQGFLRECFKRSCVTPVAYGTLSHSHLCLVLRAIVNGAKWPVPQGMEFHEVDRARLDRVLDKDGKVDMAAVAVHDPVAKKLTQ